MRVNLDMSVPEYWRYKRRYPILKDKGGYYFETSNPYISNELGLCLGLPQELEPYAIYDDEDSE